MARGVTVKDVPAHDFIVAYAAFLKKSGKIQIPEWADLVKTAPHKELSPLDKDWYYVRAAAIARQVYLRKTAGVGGLREHFGSRKRCGVARNKHAISSGGLLRKILQQLESIDVVKTAGKGRVITKQGQQDLDRIAGTVVAATEASE